MLLTSRRSFLSALGLFVAAAPAIVPSRSLMALPYRKPKLIVESDKLLMVLHDMINAVAHKIDVDTRINAEGDMVIAGVPVDRCMEVHRVTIERGGQALFETNIPMSGRHTRLRLLTGDQLSIIPGLS